MFESRAKYYAIEGRKITRWTMFMSTLTFLLNLGVLELVKGGASGKLEFIFMYLIVNSLTGIILMLTGWVLRKEDVNLIGMLMIMVSISGVVMTNVATMGSFVKGLI